MPARSLSPQLQPFRPHTYTKMKVEYPPTPGLYAHFISVQYAIPLWINNPCVKDFS